MPPAFEGNSGRSDLDADSYSQSGSKPLQVYAAEDVVRPIHGASYTRLFNLDLLTMVREFATDFVPPQKAADGSGENDGGTGLYCGEQDMCCFLIDPRGVPGNRGPDSHNGWYMKWGQVTPSYA